jgi:two-component system, OmpR family, alkaline phosphatase synthesis response regulator PhoP
MAVGKILVVDDEPGIVNVITAYLKPEGYEVFTASDGDQAIKAAHAFKPDLMILDVMLPGIDGFEVLTRIRRESQVYVILLTAKTEEMDRVIGLTVGADDYVTKPFSPRELTARVKSAFRRLSAQSTSGGQIPILSFKNIIIDKNSRRVTVNDSTVDLTSIEFDLLYTLAENRGRVLSREQLLEKVWGGEYFGEMRVVDVHLGHVRKKLGKDKFVVTVRGVGYRFEDEPL